MPRALPNPERNCSPNGLLSKDVVLGLILMIEITLAHIR